MTDAPPDAPWHALVLAKAPVAGEVKTRLGAEVGSAVAAGLAAASLLDTIDACAAAVGADRCRLALAGDLAGAVREDELRAALTGWTVVAQRGATFADRLVAAHADVPGPVVQVGMDTPQLTAGLLRAAAEPLQRHDAVLGPALDGGWWVLALRDPTRAGPLTSVPMSTATTYDDTRAALERAGLSVGSTATLSDVDTATDAARVAVAAPGSRFAREWAAVRGSAPSGPAGG